MSHRDRNASWHRLWGLLAVLVSPYFFSFGTACTHHGLTGQAFAEVYIACQECRRPEMVRGTRYVFVHVAAARFFGFDEATALGEPVQMATLERALLDEIDRPRYSGGIGEVSGIAARAATRVSWDELLELARRWRSSALAQRLGYFLDLHRAELPPSARSALLELVRPQSKIQLGSRRRWGTTGKLVRPWNVVENVPGEVLLPTRGERKEYRLVQTPCQRPAPQTRNREGNLA